jgi:hypothetical protein
VEKIGSWGINMTKLSAGGFEKVAVKTTPSSTPDNPDFTSVEKIGSFTVSQQATTFAYGKQVTNKLAMGLALKRITNTISDVLNVARFIEVREDERILFFFKLENPFPRGHHGNIIMSGWGKQEVY